MINPRKLIKMVKKWQRVAASKRKRISLPKTNGVIDSESCSTSSRTEKDHFVLYTADQRRFVIPLKYLQKDIIRELFALAEEEFGLPSGGPITLPCDADFMEYVISLIRKHATIDVEKVLLLSLATGHCIPSSDLHQEQSSQQLLICSY